MSKPKKIEDRINDYRVAHHGDRQLDDLLGDAEAEIHTLRREVKLLERRLAAFQPTLPAAQKQGTPS